MPNIRTDAPSLLTSRILVEMERTQDLYFDRVSQIKMPSWSQGRVALVGDAAFCVSLMTAMVGAYVLAGELARARHEIAFDRYEKLLRGLLKRSSKAQSVLHRRLPRRRG